MEQQIFQLATAVESLRQQLGPVSNSSFLALQHQVNALTTQAAAAQDVAQTARRWNPVRPDTFSSLRVSGRPETWLFILKTYFEAADVSTSHRVPLATTLLRGDAALWWQCRDRLVSEGVCRASPLGTTSAHFCSSNLRLLATSAKPATA